MKDSDYKVFFCEDYKLEGHPKDKCEFCLGMKLEKEIQSLKSQLADKDSLFLRQEETLLHWRGKFFTAMQWVSTLENHDDCLVVGGGLTHTALCRKVARLQEWAKLNGFIPSKAT